MDGPSTAVLIDGMPMMSALASVYGLNSISPAFVRQVEVMRGPASTLYGSEALAGVVNIITERPDYAPKLFEGSRLTPTSKRRPTWRAHSREMGLADFSAPRERGCSSLSIIITTRSVTYPVSETCRSLEPCSAATAYPTVAYLRASLRRIALAANADGRARIVSKYMASTSSRTASSCSEVIGSAPASASSLMRRTTSTIRIVTTATPRFLRANTPSHPT